METIQAYSKNSFQYILQLSDLHFGRSSSVGLKEYIHAFREVNRFVSEWPHKETTLLVISGDIFDNHNLEKGPTYTLASKCLTPLFESMPCLVFRGNHDISLSSPQEHDAVHALLASSLRYTSPNHTYSLATNNTILLHKTGLYGVGNLQIGYLDVTQAKCADRIPTPLPEPHTYRVALYHSMLRGIGGVGPMDEGAYLPVSAFSNYDFLVLGDVHAQQIVNRSRPLAAYPGSLLQLSFGEDMDKHGIGIWDLAMQRVSFHNIAPLHPRVTIIETRDGYEALFRNPLRTIPVNPNPDAFGLPPNCRVRLLIDRLDDIEVSMKRFQAAFKDQYSSLRIDKRPRNNSPESPSFADAPVESTLEIDANHLTSPATISATLSAKHNNQLLLSMAANPLSVITKEDVQEYLKTQQTNTKTNIEKFLESRETVRKNLETPLIRSRHQVRFVRLSWDRLYCFEDNQVLDLSQPGTYALLGSNYSGKSAILDILALALYGRPIRKKLTGVKKEDDLLTDGKGEKANAFHSARRADEPTRFSVSLELIVDEQPYKIIRKSNGRIHVSSELQCPPPFGCLVNNDVDRWVHEHIGSLQDLLSSTIVSQDNLSSFLYQSSDSQMATFQKWLDLERIGDLHAYFKGCSYYLKKRLDDAHARISAIQTQVSNLARESSNIDLVETKNTKDTLEKEVQKLRKERDAALQVQATIKELEDTLSKLPPSSYEPNPKRLGELSHLPLTQGVRDSLVRVEATISALGKQLEENRARLSQLPTDPPADPAPPCVGEVEVHTAREAAQELRAECLRMRAGLGELESNKPVMPVHTREDYMKWKEETEKEGMKYKDIVDPIARLAALDVQEEQHHSWQRRLASLLEEQKHLPSVTEEGLKEAAQELAALEMELSRANAELHEVLSRSIPITSTHEQYNEWWGMEKVKMAAYRSQGLTEQNPVAAREQLNARIVAAQERERLGASLALLRGAVDEATQYRIDNYNPECRCCQKRLSELEDLGPKQEEIERLELELSKVPVEPAYPLGLHREYVGWLTTYKESAKYWLEQCILWERAGVWREEKRELDEKVKGLSDDVSRHRSAYAILERSWKLCQEIQLLEEVPLPSEEERRLLRTCIEFRREKVEREGYWANLATQWEMYEGWWDGVQGCKVALGLKEVEWEAAEQAKHGIESRLIAYQAYLRAVERQGLVLKVDGQEEELVVLGGKATTLREQLALCEERDGLQEVAKREELLARLDGLHKGARDTVELDGVIQERDLEIQRCAALMAEASAKAGLYDGLRGDLSDWEERARDLQEKLHCTDILVSYLDKESKDGYFMEIMQSRLNYLSEMANEYLGRVDPLRIKLDMVGKGTKKMELEVSLHNPLQGLNLTKEQFSGHQRFIVSLCMRIAFSKLAGKCDIGHLVLDEGWTASDKERRERAKEFLQGLKMKFHSIVLITHLEEIANCAEHRLYIQRGDKWSRVLTQGDM